MDDRTYNIRLCNIQIMYRIFHDMKRIFHDNNTVRHSVEGHSLALKWCLLLKQRKTVKDLFSIGTLLATTGWHPHLLT